MAFVSYGKNADGKGFTQVVQEYVRDNPSMSASEVHKALSEKMFADFGKHLKMSTVAYVKGDKELIAKLSRPRRRGRPRKATAHTASEPAPVTYTAEAYRPKEALKRLSVVASSGDYVWPDEATCLESMVKRGANTLLVGPTGTGKSLMARKVCERLGLEPVQMTLNPYTDADALLGARTLVAGEKGVVTSYEDGPAIVAARDGRPLILNEVNAAHADTHYALFRLLEHLPVTIPATGETVNPKAGFCVIATCNVLGFGGDAGIYAGAKETNAALRSRFPAIIDLWYLPESDEVTLTHKATGVERDTASKIVQLANMLRDSFKTGDVMIPFDTRMVHAFALHLADGMALPLAFRYTVLNKVPESDAVKYREVACRVFEGIVS